MSCDMLELLLKYPLMRPINGGFEGCVAVGQTDYDVVLRTTDGCIGIELTPQLEPIKDRIVQLDGDSKNVIDYLDRLVDLILSTNNEANGDSDIKNQADIYWIVLNEYTEFRQFYFNLKRCTLHYDLSHIDITTTDEMGRLHDLVVAVDFSVTDNIFFVELDQLPAIDLEESPKKYGSLRALYEKFVARIESLQVFFDAMDELDSECWVLDPERPKRSDVHRRISLGENISILLTFNPYEMQSVPDFKLLGPERLLEKYRESLAVNLQNWRPDESVLSNLLTILDIDGFIKKLSCEEHDGTVLMYQEGDCCICYSKRLNDKLTEVVCPNKSCENTFHIDCLYQWLISINAQKSFNEIIGECPNCEKPISCPMPVDDLN